MKATFKTIKPTGKFRSFEKDQIQIKINKKEIGNITQSLPFTIRLMVFKSDINEDGNPNCTWKWIKLIKESQTIKEAKHFVENNTERIIQKYKLRYIED